MFDIDRNKKIPDLDLSLHKPNEQQVGSLTDAYNRSGLFKYAQYNELSLTIPKYVTRKHEVIPYNDFNLIRDKYLVKATYDNIFSEYMIVAKIKKSKSNGMPIKQVTLRSRQYELNGRTLRELEALSYTPEEILNLGLKGTNWTVGIIDDEFNEPDSEGLRPRRSFEETKITVLNLLYKIAETFGGILYFDTFNRTVNLHTPENMQKDKGLTAYYGKYIKSLDESINGDATTTRLFIYGKDNLTINEVNPTGQSYLEDFSYYMEGYETDENGDVVSSSPYMSDELCQALIDYNLLLIENEGNFQSLLSELNSFYEILTTKNNEMSTLQNEMDIIEDSLDIAKATNEPTGELKTQRNNKQSEIDAKQEEIDDIEADIQIINNDIDDLNNLLSLENNFTNEQIAEKNNFVYDGEWSDENYFDVNELYEKGKEVIKKMREPTKDLDLSLVKFLDSIESQNDWDRIGLGYRIHVNYQPLDLEFNAIITEMSIGFDDQNRDLGVSISNVDFKNEKDKFLDMLYGTAVSASERIKSKGKEWSDNIDKTNYLAEFLENPWETSRQRIKAGVDETVDISRRGIIVRNPNFPNERLHITAGVLALSLDDGETWSTAISPYGVAAQVIIGKLIVGEKLEIGDEEGTFTIKGNLLTIQDRNEIVRVRLGEYSANKFGLQLMNGTGNEVILDEDGILQTWQEGRTDNVDTSNGLRLYVYLPPETLSVRRALLNFRVLPFRSYAGTTESGGSTTQTSSNGGSSTQTSSSGGGVSKSTNSGGSTTRTSSANGSHRHKLFSYNSTPGTVYGWRRYDTTSSVNGLTPVSLDLRVGADGVDIYTAEASGNHSHSVSIPSHSHSFSTPNHTHSVSIPSHNHSVSIPSHTHGIDHGIYTSTFATGIGVIVNGINRTSALGGKFNSSQANIDIDQYLNVGEWNEIELTSDRLGRIDGNIFIQAFMGT
ncbi:phage tail protein [Paraliobacillus ryukyuensis]|uniref:phage tail protein n=1 Tax=Paraliobacillus ryukyuensis TaxID=200904 RepID=UPI0009A841CF|nr:phage tail protein [Paraliobacillus ryukyuensis]